MPAYLDQLSAFAAALDFAKLPADIREQTQWVCADTLAAIAAGSAEPEMRAFTERYAREAGGATIIGTDVRTTADRAALINGSAGTFLEMDEGNRFSRGHPSIHVLPAVLALAEQEHASGGTVFTGAEILSAILVGYEVGSRIGAASRLRGSMHPHGTWGTVGAAAAIARLRRFDAAKMREVINIASSLTTATSKRTMLEGGLVRHYYAGLSNQMGLLAVTLADCGVIGERDGLASVFGEVVSEHFDKARVVQGLGTEWHVMQNYFKLHSCCRYNHGTLDALDRIDAASGLPRPERIAAIRVASYAYAAELNDPAPKNTLAAKFSVPFAVATRIVNGSSGMASFTWQALRDPAVLALAQRVTVAEDPAMTKRLPQERPASVEIQLVDGTRLYGETGTNRGDDADPYTRDELRAKFGELGRRVWSVEQAALVLSAVLDLERAGSEQDLTRAIRRS